MNETYLNVLERIKEERNRLALTQNDMSRYVRMSQSNYSKVELGVRRLGYAELKYLCKSPADVQYIFTGHRTQNIYEALFEGYSYAHLVDIFSMVSSIYKAVFNGENEERWRDVYFSIEGLCCKGEKYRDDINALSMARRLRDYRQHDVADELGVDVKKFRSLETGRSLPDSELVWQLYDMYALSPAIVLKDKGCMIKEICYILENVEESVREHMIALIRESAKQMK